MPTIARLKGIIIRMYWSDHNPSHIHAEKAGIYAVFNIVTGEQMDDGPFRPDDCKIVKKWILEHSEELQAMWQTQNIHKI